MEGSLLMLEEDMYIQTKLNFGGTSPQKIDSPNSSSTHEASPQKNGRGPEYGTCFSCRKPGHWVSKCPEKSPIKPNKAAPIISDSDFPHPHLCRCGFGACFLFTSRTKINPGRKFYVCPGTTAKNCGYFKWCDSVTMDEMNNPRQYTFCECKCGAGTCHLEILKSGPNMGRKCFVCSIPKGDGACNFSQLFDAERDTIVIGQAQSKILSSPFSTDENRSNSDLVEDGDVRYNRTKKRDFESPVMENPQSSPSPVAISGPSKRNKVFLPEGRGDGEKSTISSPMDGFAANASSVPDSTRDLVISQDSLCGSTIENTLKASLLSSQADIRCRQTEFLRQISSAGDTSFEDADGSVIPSHCPLVAEPEKMDTLFPSTDGQISTGVLRDGGIEQAILLKEKISERLRQTALSLQNDLLNSLESMDVHDHDFMLGVADSTFDALKSLGVDYTIFRDRVMEFIDRMSSLAAIERSMSSQELVADRYDQEKDHYDSLSCIHAEVMAAFTTSNARLQTLHEEASSIKSKLLLIENQLSVCEVETRELESHLVDISEEVSMSQISLQAATQEAEQASKLREQRGVERSTAKAALEKAKLHLRQ